MAREGSPLKAVKLKCLDCCGWDYPETKRCETHACALWLLHQRIFHGAKPDTTRRHPRERTAA